MEPISRRDVPVELTWDLSSIYATEEEMFADMEKLKNLSDRIVRDYKGKLNTPQTINACLDDLREVYRLNILTGSYCNLAVSVDYYDSYNQERDEKHSRQSAEIFSSLSFIDSEIIEQNRHCRRPLPWPRTTSFICRTFSETNLISSTRRPSGPWRPCPSLCMHPIRSII